MGHTPKIFVALPVMDEMEMLPHCLQCIDKQTYRNFHVVVCINQPEEYWDIPEKKHICHNNKKVLEILLKNKVDDLTVIDKSSKGCGWKGNKKGVGWARKTAMDEIIRIADVNDIILSLDADTLFSDEYFSSIVSSFRKHKNAVALANSYYHKLTGSYAEDKAILRYEIYMRNYAINLLLINSPYAFTALGSAIAVPVRSYKAIGGMTPKLSGEDFYFLQKLRKYGNIIVHNKEKVFPAARFSDRVFFGTGPAMIKGNTGDWESYPIYHHGLFEHISGTYKHFPALLKKDIDTPLTSFLFEQFRSENIWKELRENFKDTDHFVRACHEKLDGLRILQYLKSRQEDLKKSDESCLKENITEIFSHIIKFENPDHLNDLDLSKCTVRMLDEIRNYLADVEEYLQKERNII
jgi:glycosyltransferase involved in cell wall biosynthesis